MPIARYTRSKECFFLLLSYVHMWVCVCIWVRWLTCYLFVCFLITFSYTERGPPCRICLRLVVSDLVNLPKMETRFCFFSVQAAYMVGFYRIRDQKKNHFTCKHWHLPLLLTFCLCRSESQSVEEITESKKYHTSVLNINQIWRTLNFSMKLPSDRWFCRSMTEFLCALQFFNMIKTDASSKCDYLIKMQLCRFPLDRRTVFSREFGITLLDTIICCQRQINNIHSICLNGFKITDIHFNCFYSEKCVIIISSDNKIGFIPVPLWWPQHIIIQWLFKQLILLIEFWWCLSPKAIWKLVVSSGVCSNECMLNLWINWVVNHFVSCWIVAFRLW